MGSYQGKVEVLLGAVSLVLLIACGNVANLLLGRGATRAKELAVRGALGAGKARIVRQLGTESLLLAGLGGLLGVLVAWAALRFLLLVAPAGVPRLESARVDGLALAFAAGAAALSSLAFGLLPALASARVDLRDALNAGGRAATARGRDGRGALVALEVAMALTLLAGAGLLVRTGLNLGRVGLGFDAEGLVTAQVTLPRAAYLGHEKPARAFESMLDGLSRQPAIQAAALVSPAPLGGDGGSNGLIPEGRALDLKNVIDSDLHVVAPGYFAALRIPLVRGRAFEATDRRDAPRVMVINEQLARAAFPGHDPIGRRISCCDAVPEGQAAWKEVVGLVADVRAHGPGAPVRPQFYLPLDQVPPEAWDWIGRSMTLVARSAEFPAAATALRDAVRRVDQSVPVYDLVSMNERRRRATAQERFGASLLSALGGVGLGLACVGIYGVIAYVVSQRTREIAIRRALGASSKEIVGLVIGQGLRPVLVGVVLGMAGAFAAGRALGAILFGVGGTDPLTLASVVALLIVAGLGASVAPVRQALRVDPARALSEG